jgi:hypothetical protein
MGTTARAGATVASLLAIGLQCWALLCHPAGGPADASAPSPEQLKRDLYVTITLAGYHCGAVGTVVEQGPSDYAVACRNGKRYRVYATAETVHVVDRSSGEGSGPPARDDHGSLVARSLFAIVNLSGYDCDQVVRSERVPRLDYRVWCGNQTEYRIAVIGDGRVAVERIR